MNHKKAHAIRAVFSTSQSVAVELTDAQLRDATGGQSSGQPAVTVLPYALSGDGVIVIDTGNYINNSDTSACGSCFGLGALLAPAFQTTFLQDLSKAVEAVVTIGMPFLFAFVINRLKAASAAKAVAYVKEFTMEQMANQTPPPPPCPTKPATPTPLPMLLSHRGGFASHGLWHAHDGETCSTVDEEVSEESAIEADNSADFEAAELAFEEAEAAAETAEEVLEGLDSLAFFL